MVSALAAAGAFASCAPRDSASRASAAASSPTARAASATGTTVGLTVAKSTIPSPPVTPKPSRPDPSTTRPPAARSLSADRVATASPEPMSTVAATALPKGAAIYGVDTTPSILHAGDSASWTVRTSPDVDSVVAHVASYSLPLHMTTIGRFGLSFSVPTGVPPVFHGTYQLHFTAHAHDGTEASRDVSIGFR